MKKITLSVLMAFLSLTFTPEILKAETANSNAEKSTSEKAEARILLDRLEVIKEMDKSKLNASEKKNLRKEVRSIKGQLKTLSGGIYLSVGAIIIIILLLILLL